MVGRLNLYLFLYCNITFIYSGAVFAKLVKLRTVSFPYCSSSPSFLPFFFCLFLPLPSELAALNGGHWAVQPRPPQPLSILAPLSPWLRKITTCTALVVFYLSSSPLHVGLTSKSWRSWMKTLAGDLPIIRSFFALRNKRKKNWLAKHWSFLLWILLWFLLLSAMFLGEGCDVPDMFSLVMFGMFVWCAQALHKLTIFNIQ